MSDEDLSFVPECGTEYRFGGPQGEDDDADAKRKAEEREKKKAEVRQRLMEQGQKGKKAKKGFLTPERKKKLRKLLMMKAAEDLKQQQLLKEQERQKVLAQRTLALPNIDSLDDHDKLAEIYNKFFEHMVKLEEEKYDINQAVMAKDAEINELTIAVNDLRGKFVKPTLKKVSKYDNKFKKMAKVDNTEKQDLRSGLKNVKKENVIENLVNKQKKSDKPEWTRKGGEKKEGESEEKPEEKKSEEPPKAEEPAPEEEAGEDEEEDEGEEEEEEEE